MKFNRASMCALVATAAMGAVVAEEAKKVRDLDV
jgi:hypothetical protein